MKRQWNLLIARNEINRDGDVCDVNCLPFHTMISGYSVQGVLCLFPLTRSLCLFQDLVISWLCAWKWLPVSLSMSYGLLKTKCKPDMGRPHLILLPPPYPPSGSSHYFVFIFFFFFLYLSFKCWPFIASVLPSDRQLCEGSYHICLGHHRICGEAHVAWHVGGSRVLAELKMISKFFRIFI